MEESNIDVLTANRMYKSRIFAMLFSDRNELLKLYNAINGTSYDDPDLLQVNTLENAVYMSMQNDVSFIIDMRLNLYEHALEQVAKERDTLLAQLKSLGGCMGCIGHMNPEARLCTDCDEAFRAWQWNGGASHDRP